MKNIQIFLLTILTVLLFSNCSDDFLNENNNKQNIVIDPLNQELYLTSGLEGEAYIQFEKDLNTDYKVEILPRNLMIKDHSGKIVNGALKLDYSVDNTGWANGTDIQLGQICIKVGDNKRYSLNVRYHKTASVPKFELESSLIDFGRADVLLNFNIYNNVLQNNNNTLTWRITDYPDWISVQDNIYGGGISAWNLISPWESSSWGISSPSGTSTSWGLAIPVICNRTKLEANKDYEGEITLVTNDPQNTLVKVKVKASTKVGNPDNVFAVEGEVKTSAYSKINNELYILAQNPNKLITYNSVSKAFKTMALPKSPTCVTLSEDGTKAYIGYSGLMTVVDLKTQKIIKSVDLDFKVFSIAYGEDNQCYMTVDANYHYGYYVCNTIDGTLSEQGGGSIDASSHVLKVKGKSSLLFTRENVSPDGLTLLDISQSGDEPKYRYWHESFGRRLWSTEDGNYMVGNRGTIFKTPNFSTSNSIFELGRLDFDGSYYYGEGSTWIDHNATTNLFYASYLRNDQGVYRYGVKVFDASDYYLKEDVVISLKYYTTIDNVKGYYPAHPFYVFTNKQGTEAYLLRNTWQPTKSSYTNIWSLEVIAR